MAEGGVAGARRGGARGGGDHVDGGGERGLGGGLMERGGKPPVARSSSSTLPLVHSLPGSQNNSHLIMMEMNRMVTVMRMVMEKSNKITITITRIITIITIMTTIDHQ